MKKKKNTLLELTITKKAFFMPCVMVYTLIFISFILWQVTEVLDYQQLQLEYAKFVQYEAALYEATNYTKNINKEYTDSFCISPTIPTKNYENEAFKITYNINCVREPGLTTLIFPGDSVIRPAFAVINNSESEVDEQTYEQLLLTIESIIAMELMYEWIGLPVDAVPTKIDIIQYKEVLNMPCILFTDIKIETNEQTKCFLIKYNCATQKIEKVIHT